MTSSALIKQIEHATTEIKRLVEAVSVLTVDGIAKAKYPDEAIKEILVNAVIHRDYNISDDIHVFVFDNRIDIKSPGRLPGHITVLTMTKERFARNPKFVRLLNRYPNPPNKDIGEGLRTAFQKMQDVRLKPPIIQVDDSSVTVTLPHESLAAPEDTVIDYLQVHQRIDNRNGRDLTGIKSENQMKEVFYRLRDRGLITLVPARGASYWRHSTPAEASDQVAAAKAGKRGAGATSQVGRRKKSTRGPVQQKAARKVKKAAKKVKKAAKKVKKAAKKVKKAAKKVH